jgi:hypothetical protein
MEIPKGTQKPDAKAVRRRGKRITQVISQMIEKKQSAPDAKAVPAVTAGSELLRW